MQFRAKSILLFAAGLLGVFSLQGQGSGNLVYNGSFEEIDGKVKGPGQLNLAVGWYPATDDEVDLYTPDSPKKNEYRTPENPLGNESAEEGESYIGARFYSEKEREMRTYPQTKLTANMKAGKTYCVKFNVSLADYSKFGVNNIGVYLSSKKITAKDIAKYKLKPQIIHTENELMNNMEGWTEICRTFKAQGGEKYLTIGNFLPQAQTQFEKLRRPRGLTGQQKKAAYYYIDNVSVINMAELEAGDCDCEKLVGGQQMKIVYRTNLSSENTLEDKRLISEKKVYFDQKETLLNDNAKVVAKEIAGILKENPKINVEIRGHSDNIEELQVLDDLSAERAKAVYDFMIQEGVPDTQLTTRGLKDTSPLSDEQTSDALARNRRVEFRVKE